MKTKILFCCATNSRALFKNANQHEKESNDYLTDAIFQAAKSNEELEVYECPWMAHMYENSPSAVENITGYGFTLRKKLKQEPNILEVEDTIKMIQDRFFDVIVTDARTMSDWWYSRGVSPFYNSAIKIRDAFLANYPKQKIVFLDGEDQPQYVYKDFYGKSLYFKRELESDDEQLISIGYCFPEKQYRDIKDISEKQKPLATVVPGVMNTYVFTEEQKYYNDYKSSYFGLTWRKLGWDCFRHHEVLFSSCVPIMPDVDDIPKRTMIHYPKELCKEVLKNASLEGSKFTKYWQHHDVYAFKDINVNLEKLDKNWYLDILQRFKEHSLKHLSSEKMLEYILGHTK